MIKGSGEQTYRKVHFRIPTDLYETLVRDEFFSKDCDRIIAGLLWQYVHEQQQLG